MPFLLLRTNRLTSIRSTKGKKNLKKQGARGKVCQKRMHTINLKKKKIRENSNTFLHFTLYEIEKKTLNYDKKNCFLKNVNKNVKFNKNNYFEINPLKMSR